MRYFLILFFAVGCSTQPQPTQGGDAIAAIFPEGVSASVRQSDNPETPSRQTIVRETLSGSSDPQKVIRDTVTTEIGTTQDVAAIAMSTWENQKPQVQSAMILALLQAALAFDKRKTWPVASPIFAVGGLVTFATLTPWVAYVSVGVAIVWSIFRPFFAQHPMLLGYFNRP